MALDAERSRETPGVGELVVPLYRGRAQRVAAGFIAVIVAAMAIGFVLLGGGLALQPGIIPKVLGVGMVVSFPLLGTLIAIDQFRSALAPAGRVVLGDDFLVIEQPATLRGAQVVPRSLISDVSVGSDVTARFGEIGRAAITRSFRRPWAEVSGPVVVSSYDDAPDMRIEFSSPVTLDQSRNAATTYGAWLGRPPDSRMAVSKLWLKVADKNQALSAFQQWGIDADHWGR